MAGGCSGKGCKGRCTSGPAACAATRPSAGVTPQAATKPATSPAAQAAEEARYEGKTAREWLATVGTGKGGGAEGKAKAREAIDTLGASAVPVLLEALREGKDPVVREFAAFAVGRIGEPAVEAVPLLIQRARDENFLVIEAAETALSLLGSNSPRALKMMVESLESPDPFVRKTAAAQLGPVGAGAKGALGALEKLLKDPNAGVREAADESIKMIRMTP